MKKVQIQFGDQANVLYLLGTLYRSPADALKEHISNAIDEHQKAESEGRALPVCQVRISLDKEKITIEYPYGMTRKEFEEVLQRVASSVKPDVERKQRCRQIGQLGIGIFSFLQIGERCVFFSRKGEETIKVVLRKKSTEAEFTSPKKRERLSKPGIKIIIYQLSSDPTKSRGPLSVNRLLKVFSEKFDSYLRRGSLEIVLECRGKVYKVEPQRIEFPRIGKDYENWPLPSDPEKRISLELYYDPSGNGKVSIRHKGIVVVENIREISAYGLEESIFADPCLRGFVDADFLTPLAARGGFEENNQWFDFLKALDSLRLSIEEEVELLKMEEEDKRLTSIHKEAIDLTREILSEDEFQDLELLEGFIRGKREPILPKGGFGFVPNSLRIKPREKRKVSLKAVLPKPVPEKTVITFKVDDPSSVDFKPKRALAKKTKQEKGKNVAVIPVEITGIETTIMPVTLTAKTKSGAKAELRILVSEKIQDRTIKPKEEGKVRQGNISYAETPFEDAPQKHSRYDSNLKRIEVNTLHPDYRRCMSGGSEEEMMVYAAMMIGKETISFNDKSGNLDFFLERFLSFWFRLRDKIRMRDKSRKKKSKG